MIDVEVEYGATAELTARAIRAQLDLLVRDEVFRSSKRSVAFLKYVVEQTLNGSTDQIKERTIGIEVFGRDPSYDTNLDHIVRTAAAELRKRLATYYVDEKHRSELRMWLVPGSYIPKFSLPSQAMRATLESCTELDGAQTAFESHIGRKQLLPADMPATNIAPSLAVRSRGSGLWGLLWPAPSLRRHGCDIRVRKMHSGSPSSIHQARFSWQ